MPMLWRTVTAAAVFALAHVAPAMAQQDAASLQAWWNWVDLEQPQAIFTLLLSVLIPLSIFVGRRNVRIRRLRLLTNLEHILFPAGGPRSLPPSFEMIRARYLGLDNVTALRQLIGWLQELGIYLLPTMVFVLVSACGFGLLVQLGGDWGTAATILLQGLQTGASDGSDFAAATGLVVGAGFLGAYVWSVNYLILRIANFDLTPLSFLSTSAHILMTVFVAWVLRQVVAAPAPGGIAVAVLLGIAFLSGLYPLLGLNVLIDRLPSWLRFKRDIAEASQIGRSFPLDLIDGIDPSIGFRLNELDFGDVQNLAAANPVELLVETPYSFGQIIDWMAQAQLLAELGPQGFLEARRHGVRDMAAFLDLGRSDSGRTLLRPLLSAADDADEVLQARIDSVAHKLHVRHLEQWRDLLSDALEASRVNPVVKDTTVTPLRATS
jgi:hypothetical protein